MTIAVYQPQPLGRLRTGVPGLDTILEGGFLQGGVYIVQGAPGTGKTILGNQICFSHVRDGGRALYITLLAENHARMLAHQRSLAFFDPAPIADTLNYLSGYSLLLQEGLRGLLTMLLKLVRKHRATLLVLDGLATATSVAATDLDVKRFIHELQVAVEASGCTTLLLTQPDASHDYHEQTMADGLVLLHNTLAGVRTVRELQISKFRGSAYLEGRHSFEISGHGVRVYPRTEALYASPPLVANEDRRRMPFGIPALDEMLLGGLLSGSSTLLLGAPGSGKTVLGSHFLAEGARRGEPGLYFGFYETPVRLLFKARGIGLDLQPVVEQGALELIWQPALEMNLDVIAERLLDAVRRSKARRLLVDGLNPMFDNAVHPERMSSFFAALINELRKDDVTCLFCTEMSDLFGPVLQLPMRGVGSLVDNIVMLRYVELQSQLYRLISILKIRESNYDPAIREFRITSDGIQVSPTFESAEAILSGTARPRETTGGSFALRRRGRRGFTR